MTQTIAKEDEHANELFLSRIMLDISEVFIICFWQSVSEKSAGG